MIPEAHATVKRSKRSAPIPGPCLFSLTLTGSITKQLTMAKDVEPDPRIDASALLFFFGWTNNENLLEKKRAQVYAQGLAMQAPHQLFGGKAPRVSLFKFGHVLLFQSTEVEVHNENRVTSA